MSTNLGELWLPVKGYEGFYQISNQGRLLKLYHRGKEWKLAPQYVCGWGYSIGALGKSGGNGETKKSPIHRLMAQAFLPNPENKTQVNHKDGNKLNNTLENLEWVTQQENLRHARETGLNSCGKRRVLQYSPSGKLLNIWDSMNDAQNAGYSSYSKISACCLNNRKRAGGYIWRYEGDTDSYDFSTQAYKHRGKIRQMDLSGVELRIWDNTTQASKHKGISRTMIARVCRGNGKTGGGFTWAYITN